LGITLAILGTGWVFIHPEGRKLCASGGRTGIFISEPRVSHVWLGSTETKN